MDESITDFGFQILSSAIHDPTYSGDPQKNTKPFQLNTERASIIIPGDFLLLQRSFSPAPTEAVGLQTCSIPIGCVLLLEGGNDFAETGCLDPGPGH